MKKILKNTPWDEKVFGFPTYELLSTEEEALTEIQDVAGHVSVKVDPQFDVKRLVKHGFYYCDTLINPHCDVDRFKPLTNPQVKLDRSIDFKSLDRVSKTAFTHGRFHRDFNIPKGMADLRYNQWFLQLAEEGTVFSLRFEDTLAGFFGYTENRIVLHALDTPFRGKGLAKYFWSLACAELFKAGHHEVVSSISADNMAILNLYATLGFRFRNPLLCYHRFKSQ
ncbi:MAG: GNAT family N-acetyltransferase [Bdellovibrionota bacterium]